MKLKFTLLLVLSCSILSAQECMDVKHKLRGYFYAGTTQKDTNALGGHYADDNFPKDIAKLPVKHVSSDKIQVVVDYDSKAIFEKGIEGFKVYIINATKSTIEIEAQDSRINMIRQVYYQYRWRDVEYLPNSWCGNSYHSLFINSNKYWDFTAPCYKGNIEAKFRFKLVIDDKSTVYSNVFNGSFNKTQLKKDDDYKPKGIMDPYND